ncbi:transglutaminase [Paenibacillus sp. SYP-B3998]|uniref:Transglutaminase n=1 Tax=Paenibacillus sp. SYP-B3998 TaxID=2678564 RepID=A0A6G4A280_9BACL|nr:transglutaminase domain-containing protein [Paenibacillus sp. SYP-B3998]NEW07931.1 transglutaminase [Paenibacillus sp. SYP-B3998]
MKKWAKHLLIFSTMLGTFSATTALIPSSVFAAAGTTVQDQLQKDITQALTNRLDSYQLTYSGTSASLKTDLNNALNAALNTNDYLHYIVKSYSYSANIQGSTATVSLKFTYWETLSQTTEVQKRVKQILDDILTTGMNEHQKEKAIHDWIVGHVAYDTKLISHSAYDALTKGKTVCQGYALLTYEMMKQAGIPVKIVEGSSRGQSHAWNLVQIGGKWYQLDCTWDDPVPDVAGRVLYNYYNITDAQLRVDHTWKASTAYPTATTAYNETLTSLATTDTANATFYNKLYQSMGYSYLSEANTATNVQTLTNKLRAAIDNRQQSLTLRYTNGTTVTADLKKAFATQKGITSYSYTQEAFTRTTTNDKLLTVNFNYSGNNGKQ